MYEVRVQTQFQAEHQLTDRDGRREPVHMHDWVVEAVFRGPGLDEMGVLIDFTLAEQALRNVVELLEGTNLNDAPFSADANPSAERLARYLFNALRDRLGTAAPLAAVYVREAPGCIAGYCPITACTGPTLSPLNGHN